MQDLSWLEAGLAFVVMTVGALVQGSVGFGSALIAAPLLALLDPSFVPAPMIMAASSITLWVAVRERRSLDLSAVGWIVLGRAPGTALGLLALVYLSAAHLGVAFAVLVLLAVAMLAAGRAPSRRPSTLFGAGLVAGVMGTVTSIGGPPVALMFHDARGPELRGTLSGYFVLSTIMSLGGLAWAGLLGPAEVSRFLVLLPGVVVGTAASRYTRHHLDRGRTRPAVLALAAVAALGILVKAL